MEYAYLQLTDAGEVARQRYIHRLEDAAIHLGISPNTLEPTKRHAKIGEWWRIPLAEILLAFGNAASQRQLVFARSGQAPIGRFFQIPAPPDLPVDLLTFMRQQSFI